MKTWLGKDYEEYKRTVRAIPGMKEFLEASEFGDFIYTDLIAEGYKGEELMQKFREKQEEIRRTAKDMLVQTHEAAHNHNGTGDDQMKEIFGDVMEESNE